MIELVNRNQLVEQEVLEFGSHGLILTEVELNGEVKQVVVLNYHVIQEQHQAAN
jgi:hypothetical protein